VDVEDVFAGLPSNMRGLLKHIGLLYDELEGEVAEVYEPLTRGLCMTCQIPLGEETILLVTKNGIVGGYCGGACYQDMITIGWLQEKYDDLQSSIQFRGGSGDAAEE